MNIIGMNIKGTIFQNIDVTYAKKNMYHKRFIFKHNKNTYYIFEKEAVITSPKELFGIISYGTDTIEMCNDEFDKTFDITVTELYNKFEVTGIIDTYENKMEQHRKTKRNKIKTRMNIPVQ